MSKKKLINKDLEKVLEMQTDILARQLDIHFDSAKELQHILLLGKGCIRETLEDAYVDSQTEKLEKGEPVDDHFLNDQKN